MHLIIYSNEGKRRNNGPGPKAKPCLFYALIAIIALAILIIYLSLPAIILGIQSTTWHSANGRIISSSLKSDLCSRRPRCYSTYSLNITYIYSVNSTAYEGSMLSSMGVRYPLSKVL